MSGLLHYPLAPGKATTYSYINFRTRHLSIKIINTHIVFTAPKWYFKTQLPRTNWRRTRYGGKVLIKEYFTLYLELYVRVPL